MSDDVVHRLRARATSESVNAHCVDVPVSKADRLLYAAQVLRELADAIERDAKASGAERTWTRQEVLAFGERVRNVYARHVSQWPVDQRIATLLDSPEEDR